MKRLSIARSMGAVIASALAGNPLAQSSMEKSGAALKIATGYAFSGGSTHSPSHVYSGRKSGVAQAKRNAKKRKNVLRNKIAHRRSRS